MTPIGCLTGVTPWIWPHSNPWHVINTIWQVHVFCVNPSISLWQEADLCTLAGIVTICRSPACEVGVSIFDISTHFCFYFAPSPFPFFSSFYNFLWLSFFISTFPFLFFYSFSVFCWSSPSLFLFPFPNFTFFLILILDHFVLICRHCIFPFIKHSMTPSD